MVLIEGEGITLSLFKGGVSKNSWTYLKVPYLVACGTTVKPSSSECEVLLDPM